MTFHFEATEDVEETLNYIRRCGVLAGLAFCPETSLSLIPKYLDKCDLILLMTVSPGFGGQAFMPDVLEKIAFTRDTCNQLGIGARGLACSLIFVCAWKKRRIIDLLGYILTPLLLTSLGVIIVMGLLTAPDAHTVTHSPVNLFFTGLKEGYNTMDLLAAFFFSSVIVEGLRRETAPGEHQSRAIALKAVKAGFLGVALLALVYIGFSTVAARYAETLGPISTEQLLGTIAVHSLGSYAGFAAAVAVSLACLTTAIALSAIFADFLQREIGRGYLSYTSALSLTLAVTFAVSTLQLSGIMAFLAPILEVCYPILIALTFYNIIAKLRREKAHSQTLAQTP